MDSFYTNVGLAESSFKKKKTDCAGTIRENRRGNPKDMMTNWRNKTNVRVISTI